MPWIIGGAATACLITMLLCCVCYFYVMKTESPGYYSQTKEGATPDRRQAKFENPEDDPSYSDAIPTEMKDPADFGAQQAQEHISQLNKKRGAPGKGVGHLGAQNQAESVPNPQFPGGTFTAQVPKQVQSQDKEGKKQPKEQMFTP